MNTFEDNCKYYDMTSSIFSRTLDLLELKHSLIHPFINDGGGGGGYKDLLPIGIFMEHKVFHNTLLITFEC